MENLKLRGLVDVITMNNLDKHKLVLIAQLGVSKDRKTYLMTK